MTSKSLLPILLGSLFALSGCAASLAAGALGAVARGAKGQSQGNEHLKPLAVQACSARASQFGTVKIIDVEQRSLSKIIIWGTASDGTSRQSFECAYTSKIVAFQLRAVRTSL